MEAEKFGVSEATTAPLDYEGERGVVGLFAALTERFGWRPEAEVEQGPVVALHRAEAAITLEPGGQLELSGAPQLSVHDVARELGEHLQELDAMSRERGLTWLAAGFHPLAAQAELPRVPKARYAIMRDYFPLHGRRGIDMMRRTATVQVNLDYADEQDAMRKMRVALRLSPLVTAMFANAPFSEGRIAPGYRSLRAEVWLDVDPDRTGLLPRLMAPRSSFADYVTWALDVPMYLFKRSGRPVLNTGQSFRSFWQNGFQGHRATAEDWQLHLSTLFPEVRLKRFIELRGADSLPRALAPAVPALWTGLLYDEAALSQAENLVEPFSPAELEVVRSELVHLGFGARLGGRPLRSLAERVMEISLGGLGRRRRLDADGNDERKFLAPMVALVEAGQCPADILLRGLPSSLHGAELRREILERTKL